MALGGAAGLVLLLTTYRIQGDLAIISGQGSARPTYWFVPVLVVWGLLVEVSSRYLVPTLAAMLPRSGMERIAARVIASSAGAAPPEPTDAIVDRDRDRDLDLDLDLDEAMRLAPLQEGAERDLMTAKAYDAAERRITGYRIGKVETDGDGSTVDVALKGLGSSSKATLQLTKHGSQKLLFDTWRLDDGGFARELAAGVPAGSSTLTVNGQSVDASASEGDDATFWALPGTYTVNPSTRTGQQVGECGPGLGRGVHGGVRLRVRGRCRGSAL